MTGKEQRGKLLIRTKIGEEIKKKKTGFDSQLQVKGSTFIIYKSIVCFIVFQY